MKIINKKPFLIPPFKIHVKHNSRADIQKKLFLLGYKWSGSGCIVRENNGPFYFISSDNYISYMGEHSLIYFEDQEFKEISEDDILWKY